MLENFPDAVLVSGCQRSGTTMVARIIFQSEGMINYWAGRDDELDAALILSGWNRPDRPEGRYCFQTTYLNECYREYFKYQGGFRLIWVLRNPHSVINSMLYNWSRFALNELFNACGAQYLSGKDKIAYQRFGHIIISRAQRACLSYIGKTQQVFEINKRLGDDLFVIDYDDLVTDKSRLLSGIYDFIDLPYKELYTKSINSKSVSKASKMPDRVKKMIDIMAMPVYQRAREILSI